MKDCKVCGAVNSESSEICYKCGEELGDDPEEEIIEEYVEEFESDTYELPF